jgi:hypothetical protein
MRQLLSALASLDDATLMKFWECNPQSGAEVLHTLLKMLVMLKTPLHPVGPLWDWVASNGQEQDGSPK